MRENIFWAKEYRIYLKECFFKVKSAKKSFSIAILSKKVGCSPSLIKKIFACNVHIGIRHVESLGIHLALHPDEKRYLYFLSIFHSVKTSEIKDFLKFILVSMNDRGRRNISYDHVNSQNEFLNAEESSTSFFFELALELSRILKRSPEVEDLELWIPPKILKNKDLKEISSKCTDFLARQSPESKNPIFNPLLVNASPFAVSSMKGIEDGIANLLDHHSSLHINMTPFTTHCGLSAVSDKDNDEILKILREAREKCIEISRKSQNPTRVIALHIHSYTAAKNIAGRK